MAVEAQRWVSYDEASVLFGTSAEATKCSALFRGWPRRSAPAGGTQVAVPDGLPCELPANNGLDEVDIAPSGARSLLDYLETHVERLTEELAEAHTEIRGVRYEAESLRIEAARAQVFAALVEAERARAAEVKAERRRSRPSGTASRRNWPTVDVPGLPVSSRPSSNGCRRSDVRSDDRASVEMRGRMTAGSSE